jgi:hypothetical protein
MERSGITSRKLTARTALLVLVVVGIPGFFWFRFLYDTYCVDRVSPQMAKMRDGMMHKAMVPDAKKTSVGPTAALAEKGVKQPNK